MDLGRPADRSGIGRRDDDRTIDTRRRHRRSLSGGTVAEMGTAFAAVDATGEMEAGPRAGAGSTDDDAGILQPLLRSRLIFIGAATLAAWLAYAGSA